MTPKSKMYCSLFILLVGPLGTLHKYTSLHRSALSESILAPYLTGKAMPPSPTAETAAPRQHGVKGAYVGGDWVDIGE